MGVERRSHGDLKEKSSALAFGVAGWLEICCCTGRVVCLSIMMGDLVGLMLSTAGWDLVRTIFCHVGIESPRYMRE